MAPMKMCFPIRIRKGNSLALKDWRLSFGFQRLKMKEDKLASKAYRIPDYKKLYPDASEEVIAVLRSTERKMQYQEYDLKREQTIVNRNDRTGTVIPGREDSYERLLEQ